MCLDSFPRYSVKFSVVTLLLACCWCVVGVLLVCCWCAVGVLLLCCWCVVGVLLVCCWCAVGVLLVCCWCAVGVLLVCCWYCSEFHWTKYVNFYLSGKVFNDWRKHLQLHFTISYLDVFRETPLWFYLLKLLLYAVIQGHFCNCHLLVETACQLSSPIKIWCSKKNVFVRLMACLSVVGNVFKPIFNYFLRAAFSTKYCTTRIFYEKQYFYNRCPEKSASIISTNKTWKLGERDNN